MLLHRLGAPFADESAERAGVYLTNALTGWEPPTEPKQHLLFTEMEEERDKAQAVKQHAPILVILGNPPYNGFAGAAMDEERDLVDGLPGRQAGRAAAGPGPERPLRALLPHGGAAHRRRGTRAAASSASSPTTPGWTASLSPACASAILEAFDAHLDRLPQRRQVQDRQTDAGGSARPERLLDREEPRGHPGRHGDRRCWCARADTRRREVRFAHRWGRGKLAEMQTLTEGAALTGLGSELSPEPAVGLPFLPSNAGRGLLVLAHLPELFPVSFPGVKTSAMSRRRHRSRASACTNDSCTSIRRRARGDGAACPTARCRDGSVSRAKRASVPVDAAAASGQRRPLLLPAIRQSLDLLGARDRAARREARRLLPACLRGESMACARQQKPQREFYQPQVRRCWPITIIVESMSRCSPFVTQRRSQSHL